MTNNEETNSSMMFATSDNQNTHEQLIVENTNQTLSMSITFSREYHLKFTNYLFDNIRCKFHTRNEIHEIVSQNRRSSGSITPYRHSVIEKMRQKHEEQNMFVSERIAVIQSIFRLKSKKKFQMQNDVEYVQKNLSENASNMFDLMLNSFSDLPHYQRLYLLTSDAKNLHVFSLHDCYTVFRMGLMACSNGIATPKIPIHPWTRTPLTIGQMYHMWNFMSHFPIPKMHQKVHQLVYYFIDCNFKIANFILDDRANAILIENAINDFVRNTDFENWFTMVEQFIREVNHYTIIGTTDCIVLRESFDTRNDVFTQINSLVIRWFANSRSNVAEFSKLIEQIRNSDQYVELYMMNDQPPIINGDEEQTASRTCSVISSFSHISSNDVIESSNDDY